MTMNEKEHKKYLRAFKEISSKILSSESETKNFLVNKVKINTPSGALTKVYSS